MHLLKRPHLEISFYPFLALFFLKVSVTDHHQVSVPLISTLEIIINVILVLPFFKLPISFPSHHVFIVVQKPILLLVNHVVSEFDVELWRILRVNW